MILISLPTFISLIGLGSFLIYERISKNNQGNNELLTVLDINLRNEKVKIGSSNLSIELYYFSDVKDEILIYLISQSIGADNLPLPKGPYSLTINRALVDRQKVHIRGVCSSNSLNIRGSRYNFSCPIKINNTDVIGYLNAEWQAEPSETSEELVKLLTDSISKLEIPIINYLNSLNCKTSDYFIYGCNIE